MRAIPGRFLPREAALPGKGYSISSQLHSRARLSGDIIKKAVVERLKAHYGMDQFRRQGRNTRYAFPCSRIRCPSVWMPAAGADQLGLRAAGVEAPFAGDAGGGTGDPQPLPGPRPLLRPPSAAAVPSPSRRRSSPKNRAPVWTGALTPRSGHFCRLRAGWTRRTRRMDREFHGQYDIWGGDLDPKAVAIASGQRPQGRRGRLRPLPGGRRGPNSTGTAPMASW